MGDRSKLVTVNTWPQRMADWMKDSGLPDTIRDIPNFAFAIERAEDFCTYRASPRTHRIEKFLSSTGAQPGSRSQFALYPRSMCVS